MTVMDVTDDDDRTLAEGSLFRALYWRALEANAVGATLAFVYLSFISPPQPEPPHGERFLFLGVAPIYAIVAALIGCSRSVGARRSANQRPTRRLVLSLPVRLTH